MVYLLWDFDILYYMYITSVFSNCSEHAHEFYKLQLEEMERRVSTALDIYLTIQVKSDINSQEWS